MTEEQVFLAALDVSDRAARIAYLDEACGQNGELRRQVEELLAVHERSGQFLDEPAAEQIAAGGPQSLKDQTLAFNNAEVDGMADNKKTRDECDDLNFLSHSTRPDSLGRLGHYEMLQILGRGGFGIVFRAFDDTLQRVVAVKMMAPQIATLSPARKRFLREARSSAQVRHENVVQVYEVGEQPLPFLTMEFIPGETLQQRLDLTGPLEVFEVLRIGRQIAEGLAAAHACDLIHRDIKPGNILLEGGSHKAKITDFGLARAADDASISQSGVIAGTPMYMAPEQALGQSIDQRADLFSLGSVLYQMVSGRPPFRASSALAVLKRVAEETPRPIPEIIPETPTWLCNIIAKLHAKNPEDRYQSAREVADVLADCEAQLKASSKLQDYSRIPRVKPQRSGRPVWVAAATAVIALGITVIALSLSDYLVATHTWQATPRPGNPGGDAPPVPVAKQEPLPPTFKNSIGMEFVIVPKGKSWLGGYELKWGDKEVEIPADFYLGKYEVTQEEWENVMGENPCHFSRTGKGADAVKDIPDADLKHFPVENVSWAQCQVFVGKLNKQEKDNGWVYRLPTQVEWEYACRGGPMSDKEESNFDCYFARPTNTLSPAQANFQHDKGLNRTCRVGSYEPNRLGLFDMHGNVAEFCDDSDRPKARFTFGGGYLLASIQCRACNSYSCSPTDRLPYIGLRLARVPSGAPSPEAKTPPAVAPFTDAEVKRIAALPAAEQVEEVRKELMRRNPGFDGTLTPTIENGVVRGLKISGKDVTDLSPVRALVGLKVLWCQKGPLSDLSPLKGMPLTGLGLWATQVRDLTPLFLAASRSRI
jgi:serine/threonine protein kinase